MRHCAKYVAICFVFVLHADPQKHPCPQGLALGPHLPDTPSAWSPACPAMPCYAPALRPVGAINLSLAHTSSHIALYLLLTDHPGTQIQQRNCSSWRSVQLLFQKVLLELRRKETFWSLRTLSHNWSSVCVSIFFPA